MNPSASFVGRDYTAVLEWLIAQAQTVVPEITDYNHSGVWMGILRLLARNTDLLDIYIDAVFSEGNITTARFMQSLIDLGTLLDIKPVMCSPAITTLRLTRADEGTGEIVIPRGAAFSRGDGVLYSVLEATSIPENETDKDVVAYQGVLETVTVYSSAWEQYGASHRYRYNLGQGVVNWSVSMLDDLEVSWGYVESFYRSQPQSNHFSLEYYADKVNGVSGVYYITLGDGVYGSNTLPASATIEFLRTDGQRGNCGTGVITIPTGDLPVLCTNTTVANGGADVESIESFRTRMPLVARTQRRGLTKEDYEALLRSIQGIASVQVIDRSNGPSWPYLYIFIYVHPAGGGALGEALQQTIEQQCTSWGHLGDWRGRYVVSSATEVEVNINASVGKAYEYSENTVTANINVALNELFEPGNTIVGRGITLAQISAAITSAVGVDWVNLIAPTTNIPDTVGAVPILGNVEVSYV